jgi:regulatory NSL complex subunit 3
VEHSRLFNNVVKALHEAYLAQLALTGRPNEAIQKKLAVDTAARRVRRAMASATWDIRLTHWLHNLLQEYMPPSIFAVYLEVLRVLRIKAPSLVDHMITFMPDVKLPPSVAADKVLKVLDDEQKKITDK